MKLSELVNISKLRELCESFSVLTGTVTAILDLEGNLVAASGWQEICTRFHRSHPATAARCLASDSSLAAAVSEGERYHLCKCQNGLIDVALPITVGGERVATFFTGQFLLEPPDREYFVRQAEEFGFDKESYLEALARVPILSEDKVRAMMAFFIPLTEMIGEMGFTAKNLEEANAELRRHHEHLEELVRERTAEISDTNRSLEAEIAERKQAEAALRQSEQRFRILAEATFEGVAITENGKFIEVNEQFSQIVGYDRSELLRMKLPDLVAPEDENLVMANILSGRENDIEHTMVRKDGSRRVVEAHGKPVAESGHPGRNLRIAAVRDITERKRAEAEIKQLNEELAERAAELELANEELEAFNHTVAHDLRQPLNFVGMCCQSMKMLCGDQLNEGCARYLHDIQKAISRMDGLIGALLNFAQMGRVEPHREMVDLTLLAREASRSLQMTAPGRTVEFRIAEGIVADCDAHLLQAVLANLLGNAWKYSAGRDRALIEFGVADLDGVSAYFVRDNGAGFDQSDADKLFTPFKRLPGADKSEGFGIGLATVERIIHKHGGKVWAEGAVDRGATIYFTLQAPRPVTNMVDSDISG